MEAMTAFDVDDSSFEWCWGAAVADADVPECVVDVDDVLPKRSGTRGILCIPRLWEGRYMKAETWIISNK